MHHSWVRDGKSISGESAGRRIGLLVTLRRRPDDGDGAVVLLGKEHKVVTVARRGRYMRRKGLVIVSFLLGAVSCWSSTAGPPVNIGWIQTM